MPKTKLRSIIYCAALTALLTNARPLEPDGSGSSRTFSSNSTRALSECIAEQELLYLSSGFTASDITSTDKRNWYYFCTDVSASNDQTKTTNELAVAVKEVNSDLLKAIKENTKELQESKEDEEEEYSEEELRELIDDHQAIIDGAEVKRNKFRNKLAYKKTLAAIDTWEKYLPKHWLDWVLYIFALFFVITIVFCIGRRWCCPNCCSCCFGGHQSFIGSKAKDTRHRSA